MENKIAGNGSTDIACNQVNISLNSIKNESALFGHESVSQFLYRLIVDVLDFAIKERIFSFLDGYFCHGLMEVRSFFQGQMGEL